MTNGVEVDIGVGTIGILLKQSYNHTNLNDMWMSILQIQMLKFENWNYKRIKRLK